MSYSSKENFQQRNSTLMMLYCLRGFLKVPGTTKQDAIEFIEHTIKAREAKGDNNE